MGVRDVGDPIAHGFTDGVFQGAAADGYRNDLCAEQAHAEDVEALPPHVFLSHINGAIEAKQRANGGGRDAMLPGAGLRDDAALAHAFREQRLAETVVDLMRAGMEQVFALDVDLRAAKLFAQPPRGVERGGAAGILREQEFQLGMERRVLLRFEISVLQLFERRHQHFRNVASAIGTEVAAGIRLRNHERRAASINCFMRTRSFLPGDDSMREQTSTPQGCACSMAARTLFSSSPPATMILRGSPAASFQSNPLPEDGPSSSSASEG